MHEYVLELVQREVEDEWMGLGGAGDEQKEGAREGRGKETKKKRREVVP